MGSRNHIADQKGKYNIKWRGLCPLCERDLLKADKDEDEDGSYTCKCGFSGMDKPPKSPKPPKGKKTA